MSMLEKLKANIDPGDIENFERTRLTDNIRRSKILAWLVIVFESILAIVSLVTYFLYVGMYFRHIQYLFMYLVMIGLNVILLVFYRNFQPHDFTAREIKCNKNILLTYITLVMCWGSFMTLMDQALYGHIVVFIVNTLLCSVVFIVDYKRILFPYLISTVILAVGLPFFQSNTDILIGHYVNLSIFLITAWLASRMIFYFYANDFKSRVRLEKSKEMLEHQIDINNAVNAMLSRLNIQLEHLSLLDDLTGIPNRRSFRSYIDSILGELVEHHKTFSVIMADIDFFKDYNDHYGHAAGDVVLKAVAGQIHKAVRTSKDFSARWGGEEFIFATYDTDKAEIEAIAQNIRQNILELKIPHAYSKASDVITISLGVCALSVEKNADIGHIINISDNALYLAKTSGRNCVKMLTDS
jgi:diguanylate cyclase (GGDEF)-like protein